MSSSLDQHAALNDYQQLTVGFAESIGAYSAADGLSLAHGPAPQSAVRHAHTTASDVLAIFDHEEDLDSMMLRLNPSQHVYASVGRQSAGKKRYLPADVPVLLSSLPATYGGYGASYPADSHAPKSPGHTGLSAFALPLSARSAPTAPPQELQWHVPHPMTSRSNNPAQRAAREHADERHAGTGREPWPSAEEEQYEDEWDDGGDMEDVQMCDAQQNVHWQQSRGGVVPLLHLPDQRAPLGVPPPLIMPSNRLIERRAQSASCAASSKVYVSLQPHTRGDHVRRDPAYSSRPSPGALREVKEWGKNLHIAAIPRKQVPTRLW